MVLQYFLSSCIAIAIAIAILFPQNIVIGIAILFASIANKPAYTRYQALGPELIQMYKQSARR